MQLSYESKSDDESSWREEEDSKCMDGLQKTSIPRTISLTKRNEKLWKKMFLSKSEQQEDNKEEEDEVELILKKSDSMTNMASPGRRIVRSKKQTREPVARCA